MSTETQDPQTTDQAQTWKDTHRVKDKSAWRSRKRHTVTLPSGAVVDVEVPDLPQMVAAGNIPNDLVDVAVQIVNGRKVTQDDIRTQADFFNLLAAATVKDPEVEPGDFMGPDALPFEDKEMLVEFATRQRDMDAEGAHLGGLEKSRDFRAFRGILSIDEAVAGL